MDHEAKEKNRKESIALAFFWLVILAYGFFIPSILSWNTESHLYPAFAMVDHHTVNIDAYHQGLGDKSFWNGHYYTDKAPGLSFLAVPVYAAMRVILPNVKVQGFLLYHHIKNYYYIPENMTYLRYGITYMLVALPSAALAILLWYFLMCITGRTGWSLGVAATYALGTMAYVYSIWYFSHQICAVLLFSAFLLLFFYVRGKEYGRSAALAAGGAGLLVGYSIISEYPTAVIGAALAVYLLAIARDRRRTFIDFVVGMLPPAALNIAYNLAAFGKPFATGYMYVHSAAYRSHIHGGFLGLANPLSYGIQLPTPLTIWQITLGTYRGIFLISPVLLLFAAGAVFMWRRREMRAEWWLCIAIVVLYFLMDASRGADTNGWSGGSSVASRHLTPMLPFMMVPIAFGYRSRYFRIIFAATAAVSIALMFMIVSSTYLFPYQDQNPILNEVLPNFFAGKILPNWIYVWRGTLGLKGAQALIPFFAVIVGLAARIVWLLTGRRGVNAAAPGIPELEAS